MQITCFYVSYKKIFRKRHPGVQVFWFLTTNLYGTIVDAGSSNRLHIYEKNDLLLKTSKLRLTTLEWFYQYNHIYVLG